jgi:hypothetical protein
LKLRSLLFAPFVLSALAVVPACNLLSGSDDLRLTKDKNDDDDDPPPPPPPALVEAAGVTITEVAIFQGVKRTLMQGGALQPAGAPVVANRAALLRVHVQLDGAYNGQPVTGRLLLRSGGTPIDVTQTLTGNSNDGDLSTTINFDLSGAQVPEDFQYQVLVGQPSGGAAGNGAATYPAGGLELIGATNVGPVLKVQLVPVQYGYDGSDRVPDTSDPVIQKYFEGFYAMYPAPSVEISLHAPIAWSKNVDAFGSGWDSLLNHITQLRLNENTPEDVYFYGIFQPTNSFGAYCNQGCVAGLGNLAQSAGDNYARAAIGLSYGDDESVLTALHEIGHTHGRNHAPCGGAQGTDPGFPYNGGGIGVWGYNSTTQHLQDPNQAKDIMGYCYPNWISDYTFYALMQRIKDVNNAKWSFPADKMNRTYARVQVDQQGGATRLDPVFMRTPPMAQPAKVTLRTELGDVVEDAAYYPYTHLEGGVVLFPQGEVASPIVRIEAEGHVTQVLR